ncbi:hypothetical protein BZA05DRAFT_408364 [Tricharina praecox]|uniref:uncharacterized protein n=1 Tax=Tricharina praecox TaxID=43433 RepID=UPI00221ED794|nr:uncharacterized protein BZA05DRAFT_408364 [Tricharina praecox]KAI5845387.1 hypothetical protein BZA05DRAFT_408364 [Tricharina praecox]
MFLHLFSNQFLHLHVGIFGCEMELPPIIIILLERGRCFLYPPPPNDLPFFVCLWLVACYIDGAGRGIGLGCIRFLFRYQCLLCFRFVSVPWAIGSCPVYSFCGLSIM